MYEFIATEFGRAVEIVPIKLKIPMKRVLCRPQTMNDMNLLLILSFIPHPEGAT